MRPLTIHITRAEILEEVAKTTSYVGAKNLADETGAVYENVFVSDAEFEMLDRYWKEAVTALAQSLAEWITADDSDTDMTLELSVADGFNDALTPSLEQAMRSYLTESVLGKWYAITAKEEAQGSVAESVIQLKRIEAILHQRKRPVKYERE